MSISQDFLSIIKNISERIEIPLIKEIAIPNFNDDIVTKKSNFIAIQLEDNSIGIVYIGLSPNIKEILNSISLNDYIETKAIDLAKEFLSSDVFQKTLGLGAINAISQYIFNKVDFSFDFNIDSLGQLNINKEDIVGMVGYFRPLVGIAKKAGSKLIVIEKKEHLVREKDNLIVTMDPSFLQECNKVLITSSTLLNDTLDNILKYCTKAEKTSIIGPTAGFLPDPLFKRGVSVVGGTFVAKSEQFIDNLKKNIRWGSNVKKYGIIKENYPGIDLLLKRL